MFILTGALIAYALSLRTLKKWGYDSEMLENFFVPMLLIAIIGARLYYVIFERERYVADPIRIFSYLGGRTGHSRRSDRGRGLRPVVLPPHEGWTGCASWTRSFPIS